MTRLENVSIGELEVALDEVTDKREIQRLMDAIIYKRGPPTPMVAEWLGTREQTLYRWSERFENQPLRQAVQNQ